MLYECLTGIPPYDGTPAEVMASHLYLPLPPLPASAPAELDTLVARLTVKDPVRGSATRANWPALPHGCATR